MIWGGTIGDKHLNDVLKLIWWTLLSSNDLNLLRRQNSRRCILLGVKCRLADPAGLLNWVKAMLVHHDPQVCVGAGGRSSSGGDYSKELAMFRTIGMLRAWLQTTSGLQGHCDVVSPLTSLPSYQPGYQ